MSELVVARLVAAVFAAAGALGIPLVFYGQNVSQEGATTAAVIVVSALGSLYAAVRTWRRGRLAPTSKHAVDPKAGQSAVVVDGAIHPAALAAIVRQARQTSGQPPAASQRLREMLDHTEDNHW